MKRSSLREMQQVWRSAPASAGRDRANGDLQLNSGGYGFGLRVSQTCSFRHIVAHGGGLPGFGTLMTWLPEYGVGIVELGDLTYTGWGRVTTHAFERLAKTGGLTPRMPAPSAALTRARETVSQLILRWDDRLADSIAAENLFLDQSKDRRRAEIERLRSTAGTCSAGTGFDFVENALRGRWTMRCDKGSLEFGITLAPTMPPRVQSLAVRPAPAQPPSTSSCTS